MTTTVLIVDDSAFMRVFLTDLIDRDEQIEVVGTARNGQDAIEKIKQIRPNVVTMDVEMPVMNGIEAVRILMETCPTPVIMLSTLTTQGADATIQALRYGAFDFMPKPVDATADRLTEISTELVAKIKAAAAAGAHTIKPLPAPTKPAPQRGIPKRWNPPGRGSATTAPQASTPAAPTPAAPTPAPTPVQAQPSVPVAPTKSAPAPAAAPKFGQAGKGTTKPAAPSANRDVHQIVALGTSTGGPRALDYLLPQLPATLEAPVVLVQHMPPNFTKSLAERLDHQCELKVVEAEDGDRLQNGVVYIAPGGRHMTVEYRQGAYVVALNDTAKRNEHRPSVDVLFESVAALPRLTKHYVILTGMGSDGASGMAIGKEKGATTTIAESQLTCVVFGMPKSAIERGCVDHVLDLQHIAPQIIASVRKTAQA